LAEEEDKLLVGINGIGAIGVVGRVGSVSWELSDIEEVLGEGDEGKLGIGYGLHGERDVEVRVGCVIYMKSINVGLSTG
jgi:hypothetical protein